jgi:hypothetical protein
MTVHISAILGGGSLHDQVLQNCRFEGFGTEAYGSESIADLIRLSRLDGSSITEFGDASAMVATSPSVAVYVDVYLGRAVRMWLLGSTAVDAPVPRLSVPIDPDRDQRGPAALYEEAEFPLLAPYREAVEDGWRTLSRQPPFATLPRLRGKVIRALAADDRWAALLHVGALSTGKPVDCYALLHDRGAVVDEAGLTIALKREWQPALRA